MEKIRASVIVAAFNAEKTIEKCLRSLLGQSFKGYEVIVVDDESADATRSIVAKFPKARLVRQRHAGPAVARNNGAKAAKGEIIVFTDSDCIAEPNWLEEMLKPFSSPEVAGVQGRYKCGQKELVARLIQLEIEERYEKMKRQKFIDFIGSYSAAYRKSVFEKLNGFDTSYPMASGEDTDFSFRVSTAGHKMVFNQNAVVYHTHPTSLKKYFKVKFFRAFWRVKVYRRHKGKMMNDSYTSQKIKLQIALFCLAACLLAIAVLLQFNPINCVLVFILILIVSASPFAAWAFRRDRAVALCSMPIIALRTVVFSCGLVLGTINQLREKK